MRPALFAALLSAVLCAALLLPGCAYIGDPKPPTLDIPSPVADLRAAEFGARILVEFTIPPLTTEGLGLTGVQATVLHVVAGALARDYNVPATGPGAVRYEFPARDWIGKQVTLTVRATGPKEKTSATSNAFQLSVGEPLPPPADLRTVTVPDAVRLTWSSAAPRYWIFRATADAPAVKLAESDVKEYLDTTIDYGVAYKYSVQAIDTLLRQSEVSDAVGITPRDSFPPAVPAGLTGVAAVNSIELAWTRNTESDFTGYYVYRSVEGAPFERVAGPIDAPTYSDRAVEAGKTYRYTVSAIDNAGNESARSMVAEITAQ